MIISWAPATVMFLTEIAATEGIMHLLLSLQQYLAIATA